MRGHGLRRSVGFEGAYSPLGSDFAISGKVSDDIVCDQLETAYKVRWLGIHSELRWIMMEDRCLSQVKVNTSSGYMSGFDQAARETDRARLGKKTPQNNGNAVSWHMKV